MRLPGMDLAPSRIRSGELFRLKFGEAIMSSSVRNGVFDRVIDNSVGLEDPVNDPIGSDSVEFSSPIASSMTWCIWWT